MPTVYKAPTTKKSVEKKAEVVKVPKNTPEAKVSDEPKSKLGHIVEHGPTRMTPVTFFAVNPQGLRFETQQEDEVVSLFLRQHFFVNASWIVLLAVMVFAPTFFFPLFITQMHLPVTIPTGYYIVGTVFWYIATFGFALGNFLRWYFNIYIVTNERAVDIDFVQLLYKEFSEARLTQIQDITYKTSGFFAVFFDYGNVYIQTAGNHPNFEFLSVPKPARVVETISELVEKRKKEGGV